MFFLGNSDGQKLKLHSGTSRNGKHVVKIEVEYTSAIDMAMDLEALDKIRAAQSAKPRPPRKRTPKNVKKIERTKTLALPAPKDFG